MKFWTDITHRWELTPSELLVMEAVCREIDLIDRMEAHQREDTLIGIGSQGQPVAAPMVAELRQHRGTLATLLKQLHLPEDDKHSPGAVSAQARAAVNARWARVNRAAG